MSWAPSGDALRQGDIVAMPAFPLWDLARSTRQVGPNDLTEAWTMPRHKAMEWDALAGTVAVAICSHDCDLENPRERTGIILAPLVKVPARPGDEKYNAIMSSSDTSTRIDYVHLFPVSYSIEGGASVDAVVDFSALTSLAKAETALAKLSPLKVLEADNASRSDFGRKLALFLGRPYQDAR